MSQDLSVESLQQAFRDLEESGGFLPPEAVITVHPHEMEQMKAMPGGPSLNNLLKLRLGRDAKD